VLPVSADGQITEPHKFSLLSGEREKVGFVARKTGAINVTVTWQGSPLSVTLMGPQGTQPITRQGSGEVKLSVVAGGFTDNSTWFVSVAEQNPSTSKGKPAADGTINIQYTSADKTVVTQSLQAKQQDVSQKLSTLKSAASTGTSAAQLLNARKIALEKEVKDRQSAQKVQALNKVATTLNQQVSLKKHYTVTVDPSTGQPQLTATATASPASNKASSANSTQALGPSAPQISSLDRTSGDPGTPVIITGTNFTNAQGEVHFIIGTGKDVTATVEPGSWMDNQILTYVPDASGIQAYDGQMYVRSSNNRSLMTPFHFVPAMDTKILPIGRDFGLSGACGFYPPDIILDQLDPGTETAQASHMAGLITGCKDNDTYFNTTVLKNGWVVDQVTFFSNPDPDHNSADAYVTTPESSYKGTATPRLTVHWWSNAIFSVAYYSLSVTIKGPKGTDYK
jgi:hypothetical protein